MARPLPDPTLSLQVRPSSTGGDAPTVVGRSCVQQYPFHAVALISLWVSETLCAHEEAASYQAGTATLRGKVRTSPIQ